MHSLENKSELKSSKRKPWPDDPPHNIVVVRCSVVIVVVGVGGDIVVVIVQGDHVVEVDVNLSIAPVNNIPDLSLLEYYWQLIVVEKVDHGMLKIKRLLTFNFPK